MNKPRFKVEKVEEALRAANGIRSLAAKKLGCVPSTITEYVKRHPQLQEALEDIEDILLDLAESKMIKLINDEDPTMIRYLLSTKGKKRGYTTRVEQTGPGGGPVETVSRVDLSDLTQEERDALRQIVERRAGEAGRNSQ